MGHPPVVAHGGDGSAPAAASLSRFDWLKDSLRSITDIIRTLPPYWRAISLMFFMFLVMFLVLIERLPNQAWLALVAALLIGMTGILYQPAATDPGLAAGQDQRNEMIVPKKSL